MEEESSYCIITTAFEDKENAENTIKALVEERLVVCAHTINIQSMYWWDGKIENHPEYFVQMKTKKSLFKEVEKRIKELHNYEVPEIAMIDIKDGSKEFLDWIEKETK